MSPHHPEQSEVGVRDPALPRTTSDNSPSPQFGRYRILANFTLPLVAEVAGKNDRLKFKTIFAFCIVILIFAFLFLILLKNKNAKANELDSFAQCLANRGAVMYGADWCPHCQNEKKAFGSSFKYIPYVECPDDPQKCIAAGINGYPTWIFPASLAGGPARPDGKRLEGEQGIEKLARESGCVLPR